MQPEYLQVAVDVPLPGLFEYAVDATPGSVEENFLGRMVRVPWGSTQRLGIVFGITKQPQTEAAKIKACLGTVAGAPILSERWRALLQFAADYYHCGIGELAVPVVPKLLRKPANKPRKSLAQRRREAYGNSPMQEGHQASDKPNLTTAQQQALDQLKSAAGFEAHLLYGVTGSGKTEVYLQWFEVLLKQPGAQVLLLVPEIGLTPQLIDQVERRFPHERVGVLHSGLTEAQRARHWLAAADGDARILIGTRLAVLTPLPGLAGIVVDEEHDPSYRQMDGVHYSARDLAIARASIEKLPVLLGSATPSVETWVAVQRKRYKMSRLTDRATGAHLPALELIDLRRQTLTQGFSAAALEAIGQTSKAQLQSLIFLNRRGFAPVLQCSACGWVSECDSCSSYRVLHRTSAGRYRLICHHCTSQIAVPSRCPRCGDVDLRPMGHGTQRVEDNLSELFPDYRIARLDRDVSAKAGEAARILSEIHGGETDLIVGTQILAKGHDFKRLGLVLVLDADQGLFSSDFRAPERLFANLMQVAGRAGRVQTTAGSARVLVQTRHPDHPLFGFLRNYDYDGFVAYLLQEREQHELPPFRFHALLKAQGKEVNEVMAFLEQARRIALSADWPGIRLFSPVPMPIQRVANLERAQLLVESVQRKQLHQFLDHWLAALRAIKGRIRWQLEVDPQEI